MSLANNYHQGVQERLTGFELPVSSEATDNQVSSISEGTGYTSMQVIKIIGITYRQLDHWDKKNFIKPSARKAKGSGSRRLYSYQDLLRLKVAKRLLDGGVDFDAVVKIFSYIERLGDNIQTANLIIDDQQVRYARDDQEILDLVKQGQGVLNVVGVPTILQELDGKIVEIFSAEAASRASQPDQSEPKQLAERQQQVAQG